MIWRIIQRLFKKRRPLDQRFRACQETQRNARVRAPAPPRPEPEWDELQW